MKKNRIARFAFGLLFLSTAASAGVPETPNSHDFDIGTLGTTHYTNSFSYENNLLDHSYTFDLTAPSQVDASLLNTRIETGNIFTGIPPLTIGIYDLYIMDSDNHELFKGATTSTYTFGSTMTSHVGGVLPAGDNYYVRVVGGQLNDVALSYQVDIVATPVPEPETFAMFLAGLGLLGWRLRKA
jgi:hypothetical protein